MLSCFLHLSNIFGNENRQIYRMSAFWTNVPECGAKQILHVSAGSRNAGRAA